MKNLFFVFFLLIIFNCLGQSDPKLSVFNFNPLVYNPSFAGSSGTLSIIGIHSSQFLNFDGAPHTQYFSAHGLFHNHNLGLGLDIINDQFDITKEFSINSNISYFLKLNDSWKFSFGLKAGLKRISTDYSSLNILDPDEDIFQNSINLIQPNLGIGFYLSSDLFYIGASTPTLILQDYSSPFESRFNPKNSNYYLTTGYNFFINDKMNFRPSALVRVVNGAPYSSLFSLIWDYNSNIFTGINYETKSSIGALIGFEIIQDFNMGYAIDHSTSGLARYTKGSHTVFLSYKLNDSKRKSILPCFYY